MQPLSIITLLSLLTSLSIAASVSPVPSQLVNYDLNNTDQLNASFVQAGSGIVASSVSLGRFYGNSASAGRSAGTNQNLFARLRTSSGGMVVASTAEAALDANNASYFEFTITPGESRLDLASITADLGGWALSGSSADFTATFFLRSSADNYASNIDLEKSVTIAFRQEGAGDLTMEAATFSLSDETFRNLNTSVTFRLYIYATSAATSTNQTVRIDNIAVNGSVLTSIPEPATGAAVISIITITAVALLRRRGAI